jgi:hypothetical protein
MKHRATLVVGLLLSAGPAHATAFDLHTLLARIARPAPDTVGFVEVRYSRLLKTPLSVAGTLERGADGSLVRRIESPYRETTTVRGKDVLIERADSKARRFSLERAPELGGLLGSIDGMLRGDATLLDRSFETSLEGTWARWLVRLVPRDARLHARLENVAVYGDGDEPRCFAMIQTTGDASIIALGVTAAADLPIQHREELEAWCRNAASAR